MKFIRSETPGDASRGFYQARINEQNTGKRNFELRNLWTGLVSACNTVADVHEQGVVHCDIKPHNIMLGRFDKTPVVDWGLSIES